MCEWKGEGRNAFILSLRIASVISLDWKTLKELLAVGMSILSRWSWFILLIIMG